VRKAFLRARRSLAFLVVLAIPLALAATASASTSVGGGPSVGHTPAVTSTVWSTVTPIAAPAALVVPAVLCSGCAGGGITPACYTYNEYGQSYLNSGAEGINMHLWFSACHDGGGTITSVWGAGQTCDAWGFINERNAYVNQDSGGVGQTYVKFHSHCEFSPSIGPISTFWIGHDLYAQANGTD
jgi:hypothetical protein